MIRRRAFSLAQLFGAAVLLASVALPLPSGGAILGLPSPCPFFHLTGLPCPGCGLTRAFVCCGHGDWVRAFAWHPLGPLGFGATLVWALAPLLGWRLAPSPRFAIGVAALLLVVWVLRLSGVCPLPNA